MNAPEPRPAKDPAPIFPAPLTDEELAAYYASEHSDPECGCPAPCYCGSAA